MYFVLRFLIVGFTTVGIDFFVYWCLLYISVFSIETSKGIGFLSGTIFSYFTNKSWTFDYKSFYLKSALKFILLYTFTMFINIFLNSSILSILDNLSFKFIFAFLFATIVSAILNFLGMKFLVFKF